MDYHRMTAPCGLDCFNCTFYLAPENPDAMAQIKKWSREYNIPLEIMECRGCRYHGGQIPVQMFLFGDTHRCAAYECSKHKGHHFCGECEEFPFAVYTAEALRTDEHTSKKMLEFHLNKSIPNIS